MKVLKVVLMLAALISIAACGGDKADLIGQMPLGYDLYFTFDPEAVDMAGILENLEETLYEDAIEEIEDFDFGFDVFDWDQWKTELGILDGEIGVIVLTEQNNLTAVFLPCGDGSRLEEFIEEGGFGETEFFVMDNYTVMVINWDENDDLLDDFEEALAGDALSSEADFLAMAEASAVDGSGFKFFVDESVTEVPIFCAFSRDDRQSIHKITVLTDNDDVEDFLGVAGEGLISSSIMLPENTMGAVRVTLNTQWLIDEYENILDDSQQEGMKQVEEGLPFIGYGSMEEFLAVFQGDFVFALSSIELDGSGKPEDGQGVAAFSLTESETLVSSLSLISAIADASHEDIGDVRAYSIEENDQDICFFIKDDVFYVTMNLDPEDVIEGVDAADYFTGIASEGFMGAAADPQGIMEGIEADEEMEELISAIFEDKAVFSLSCQGQMFTATTVAGPDIIKSVISVAVLAAESSNSEIDMNFIK